jgi:hypothetical protein
MLKYEQLPKGEQTGKKPMPTQLTSKKE